MNDSIILISGAVGLGLLLGLGLGVVLGRRLASAGHTHDDAESPAARPGEIATAAESIGQTALDAVGLASLAMAVGDVERARFILENLMNRHHHAIAERQPWDMLFDIHRQQEDRPRFEALAAHYRQTFGTESCPYASWPAVDESDLPRARPRLIQELAQRWSDARAALALLEASLSEMARPGRLPYTALQTGELLFLRDCALQIVQAQQAAEKQDPQAAAPPRRAAPTFSAFSALEERYTRIVKEVVAQWPRPECKQFLANLIVDDRVTRQGFAEDVLGELVFLRQVLDEISH